MRRFAARPYVVASENQQCIGCNNLLGCSLLLFHQHACQSCIKACTNRCYQACQPLLRDSILVTEAFYLCNPAPAGRAAVGDVLHEPGQHVQQAADAGRVHRRHGGLHPVRPGHEAQQIYRGALRSVICYQGGLQAGGAVGIQPRSMRHFGLEAVCFGFALELPMATRLLHFICAMRNVK